MSVLTLASTSTSRQVVLRAAGIAFEVRPSGVDEDALHGLPPDEHVRVLATAKALAVANTLTDAVVLGCDSMLLVDGTVLGKPRDAAQALAWWEHRANTAAELLTGHCLVEVTGGRTGRMTDAVVRSTVHFAAPTPDEIRAYVATGEPLTAAGAFTIEGHGAPFMKGITGDYTNVLGLSVPTLRTMLKELDLSITDFWT